MLTSTFEVRNKITGEIFEVCTIRTEELEFPVYNEDEEIIAYKSEQFIFFSFTAIYVKNGTGLYLIFMNLLMKNIINRLYTYKQ